MATFTGHAIPVISHVVGALRNPIYGAPTFLHEYDGWLPDGVILGTLSSVLATAPGPVTRPGNAGDAGFGLAGFGGQFYNRLQITPEVVDFGNLMTPVARTINIWNAYLTSQFVASMTESGTDGLIMESAFDLPGNLLPLQAVDFTLTATLSGPNEINGSYVWTIGGSDYGVAVYGSRIVVFPFLPDWSDTVVDELAWLTTVERAYAGDEQRRGLREIPRKTQEMTVTVRSPHEAQYLENAVFGWQARQFAVPVVTESSRLTANASLGSVSVSMETTDRGFYPGQYLLIFNGLNAYESVEIAAVNPGSIALVRPLANAWPVGTLALPTELAHLGNAQDIIRLSDYYLSARLEWSFAVSASAANTPSAVAALNYRGQEVWLTRPDWSVTPSFTYENDFLSYGDGDMGVLQWRETGATPSIVRQHRWQLKNRSEARAFREFLARRAGRRVPCWVPTWTTDFFMVGTATSTSSSIWVIDNGYRSFSAGSEVRQDIAIFLKGSSTPILRRILLVVDNFNGTVALNLDSPIGQSFAVDDVSRICFIGLFRLGSDSISVQWLSDTVASVTLNLVLVKG